MALTKVNNDLQDALAAAQPTITSTGTLTGFTSTGIDDNATSNAITIDASERVGIGCSPSAPLQVASTPSDTVGAVGISLKDKDNAIEFGLRLDAAAKDLQLDRYYNGSWHNTMSFDRSSGNVGIGQSSPSSDNGTTVFLHIGDSNKAAAGLVLEDNENQWEILSNGGLQILDGTSQRMAIDSSGRVGINRTPSITGSKLEVGGADNTSLINVEASGVTGGMGIGSTGLQLFHGSSAKVKIDSGGRVTMPSQPAFDAHHSGGSYASGTTVTSLDLNTVRLNRGNHYSASNDRFIAPVAGVYVFYYRTIISGTYTNLHIRFRKNGVHIAGGDTHASPPTAGWSQISSQILLQLAVNDYVQVEHTTNTNIYGDSYQTFQGHLLG
jgi:hypothetical protein|tara:strand:- start:340 stop:1485 length:1146 start_codon:yes stop_codon:yes gene_type:complete